MLFCSGLMELCAGKSLSWGKNLMLALITSICPISLDMDFVPRSLHAAQRNCKD